MGRSLLAALALAGFGTPAEPPDGRLVLGLAGHDERLGGVTREWVAVADPRTGAIRRRRLAGGTLCHGPVLAVGDRIVLSGYSGRRAVARSLPLTLRGAARSLGPADTFTASTAPGRLWLGDWGRPVRRWTNHPAPVSLRELSAAGHVTARVAVRMPRFAALHAQTGSGFVAAEGRWLTLRRARRPLLRIRDAAFVAAGRTSFAWCRGDCTRLGVWSPRGRRVVTPPGMRPVGSPGAFSPDERRLAVAVTAGGRTRAAVVDLASGRWTLTPGRVGGYAALAWSPSGRWLYFGAGDRGLRAWSPARADALSLPIDAGGTVMSIAVAR